MPSARDFEEHGFPGPGLSERDRAVLDFEGAWWLYPEPKDQAVKEYLGISATRYYQALRRLVDDDVALRYAPLTIRRLRRIRNAREQQAAARLGGDGLG
jgi:hypothetical protein